MSVADGSFDGAKPVRTDELGPLFDRLGHYATLIVAVSGGADSTALMHLLARWTKQPPAAGRANSKPPRLVAATVDHGLRAESAGEAALVANWAAKLGIAHHTLLWQGPKPVTAIQAAAREARYRLLEGLALAHPAPSLVMAHHQDDQAETVLMRLARGSGLDGLAGIRASRRADFRAPVPCERPLLGLPKARLVATLEAGGIAWNEDPSNDSAVFERVRWRQARASLAALGLTRAPLARSAIRLDRARQALDMLTSRASIHIVTDNDGAFARLDHALFDAEPEEIRLRLLMRALTAFGGEGNAPSLAQAETLLAGIATGVLDRQTLAGSVIEADSSEIRVFREPGRRGLPSFAIEPGDQLNWDNRFQVTLAPEAPGGIVRGLDADGLAALRRSPAALRFETLGLPARIARTLPSYWIDGRLGAVPRLGYEFPGFAARFLW